MPAVHLVVVLAVVQYILFVTLVGRARGRYGVKAPATTGPEPFERALRVQTNTLEQLVAFMPAVLLADVYWPWPVVSGLGLVYLIGRFVYWRAYLRDPSARALGFALTMLPTIAALVLAAIGAVRTMLGGTVS